MINFSGVISTSFRRLFSILNLNVYADDPNLVINFATFSRVPVFSVETLQCTLVQINKISSITSRLFLSVTVYAVFKHFSVDTNNPNL